MQIEVGGHCCHSCIAVMRRERANVIGAIFTDVFRHFKLQVMFCAAFAQKLVVCCSTHAHTVGAPL